MALLALPPAARRITDDERAIRELVATWIAATEAGDMEIVLGLMAEDVVFMVPGREPFGREVFEAAAAGAVGPRVDAESDIREIHVLGDWGWMRNRLEVTMTPPDGGPAVRRCGYTLTILRREPDGRWVIARDANLLAEDE